MSSLSSNEGSALSTPTTILAWTLLLATLGFLTAASTVTGILSIPVLAVPVIVLRYCYIQGPTDSKHLETLIWTLLSTGTLGVAIVAAVQTTLFRPLASLLFDSRASEYLKEFTRQNTAGLSDADKRRRAEMARKWQYFAFLFIFCFGLAALTEEVLKYSAITFASRWGSIETEQQYLQCAIAATLGFSTVENIGFIYGARTDSRIMLVVTVLERIVLGMPGHALSGCLLALSIVRRDLRHESVGLLGILAFPTFYHGLWDFSLFAISALNGNIGWVHPKNAVSIVAGLGMAVGISIAAFCHVQYEMRDLGVVW